MPVVPIVTTYNPNGFKRAQRDFNRASKDLSGVGDAAKSLARMGVGAVVAAGAIGAKLIGMAEDGQQAEKRLANITDSMGIFGDQADEVAERLNKLADVQGRATGVDDDSIRATQAKLMTFKELAKSAAVAGGAFDRATTAAIDLAAAGFGTAETNATALGKAMNDPIKGITSLTRAGVTFTEQEKDKIKTLVESGKTLEAQEIILAAIETQVGGTAAASAKASDKMKVGWSQAMGSVGELLLPAFEKFTAFVNDRVLPIIRSFVDKVKGGQNPIQALSDTIAEAFGPKAQQVFDKVIAVVGKMIEGFKKAAEWVSDNREWLEPIVAGILAMIAAYKAWTVITRVMAVAQAALNIVLLANPMGLYILAVVGLVAALVYAWQSSEKFREIITKVWESIKSLITKAWESIKAKTSEIWDGVKSFLSSAWQFIVDIFKVSPLGIIITNFSKIVDWFKGLDGKIKNALGDLSDLLKDAGRSIIQGLWNGMKSLWESAKKWVTGIADWIKQNKGPITKDVKLLEPHGRAIIQGLENGMKEQFDKTMSFVLWIGERIAAEGGGWGIFDEASGTEDVTGSGLLKSLKSPVEAARSFNKDITTLAQRGLDSSVRDALLAAKALGEVGGSGGRHAPINNLNVAPGAIVVNAAPGDSPKSIADAILDALSSEASSAGTLTRMGLV